jgi:hypothetical protein
LHAVMPLFFDNSPTGPVLLEHRIKHDCNAEEGVEAGTAVAGTCRYVGVLLLCNCLCAGLNVIVIAVGHM